MTVYAVLPHADFGRGFHLEVDGEYVAEAVELARDEFEIRVGPDRYRVANASFSGTNFDLVDAESRVVATAERPDAIGPRYEIRTPGLPTHELQPVSTFGRKHHVIVQQNIVGLIDPDDLTTRTTVADLPESLDLPRSAFLIWLVLRPA